MAALLCQIEVLEIHPKVVLQNSSLQFYFHFYRSLDLPFHTLRFVESVEQLFRYSNETRPHQILQYSILQILEEKY